MAVESYRQHKEARGKQPASYKFLDLWVEVFGNRQLCSIRGSEIEGQLNDWQRDRGWSDGTRNIVLSQLSGLFTYAMRHEWVGWGDNADMGLVADFVEAVRERRAPSVTGEDGLRAVEVTAAAYESARTNRVISF